MNGRTNLHLIFWLVTSNSEITYARKKKQLTCVLVRKASNLLRLHAITLYVVTRIVESYLFKITSHSGSKL